MKRFKSSLSVLAIFALLLTSCSKENEPGLTPDGEKATLSFGAVLNDLIANRAQSKQAIGDLPECSDDDPAYVEIALYRDGAPVVGNVTTPFRVNLVAGQVFTEEVPELELTPDDNYTLEYFKVHRADGRVLWIAPRTGSALGEYVDTTLPLNIDLRAGVKKYIDVEVLCFDNRDVNQYGYLFFNIDTNEAIEFCIFGNYCPPAENGRHYPAEYSVSVWSGTDASGTPLYTNVRNSADYYDNGDFYAEPLCFALPDTEGDDNYYFEITLRSSDEYGNVTEEIIRSGAITDNVVRTFFDGENNLEYYHFREGCGDDEVPIFDDPRSNEITYATCAYPMNNSNSVALAYFQVNGNQLKTTVVAAGMTPNQEHPQHLHGFDNGDNSVCPPASAAGSDNLISIEEGAPFYGGVQLALNYEDGSFPTANSMGVYTYNRTFNLNNVDNLPDLEKLTVVAHGRMVDNNYVASLPVACGQVNNLNNMDH